MLQRDSFEEFAETIGECIGIFIFFLVMCILVYYCYFEIVHILMRIV